MMMAVGGRDIIMKYTNYTETQMSAEKSRLEERGGWDIFLEKMRLIHVEN